MDLLFCKNKRYINAFVALILSFVLLTSCANKQTEVQIRDSVTIDDSQPTISEFTTSYTYVDTTEAIDNFMSKYAGSDSEENDICIEQNEILDYSEESVTIDNNQQIISEFTTLYTYVEATESIDSFMSKYIGKNSEGNDISIEQNEMLDYSEEGVTVNNFFNDQTLLRCQLISYGGIGKSECNYYLIDDFGYYTVLNSIYDSYPLTKSKGEILYYSFDEYWICGDESYYIDRINEQLISCNQNPISPIILENINTVCTN